MKNIIKLSTKQEILDFLNLHEEMERLNGSVIVFFKEGSKAYEFKNSGEITFNLFGIYYTAYAITRLMKRYITSGCNIYDIIYSLVIFKLNEGGSRERINSNIYLVKNALLEVN